MSEEIERTINMTWCDKLGTTPAFGFTFDAHFASSSTLLDAITSITESMIDDKDKVKFTIDRQEQFLVSITSFTGFNYVFDQSRAVVMFQHRMQTKRISGAPPIMNMISTPSSFSDLLEQTSKKALSASKLLPNIASRKLKRIGIMCITVVDAEKLPPGITSLIEYQSKAWKGSVVSYSLQFVVELGSDEKQKDRCIFTVAKPDEADDDLVTLQLDWQRTYDPRRSSSSRTIEAATEECKAAATSFFESLGEGGGFNEIVYSADE